MSRSSTSYRQFLNVHIVWHPDFSHAGEGGEALAEKLYREFCRDPEHPMSPAIGVPIYFRTSSAEGIAPAPIDLSAATYNVLVFFVDSAMVLDEAYQTYAGKLAEAATAAGNARILAFVWPQSGTLRLGNTQQISLPADETQREATIRMKFAAETCRLLQQRPRGGDDADQLSMEPPRLFISHAKRDAEDKAIELKSLVEMTPIDTFFDRVDIAAGYDFTEEIRHNIRRSAVLAWQSDEYGSRPWCNIELITAKEHLRPIIVVLGVKSGEERSFPYLGNVRTIVRTETNSAEIIIAAVREYLRKLYTEGRFQSLSDAGIIPHTRFTLFRPPEPIDGAMLERKSRVLSAHEAAAAPSSNARSEHVLYPDPPLGALELEVLSHLFPHLSFMTPATAEGKSLDGLKVALSLSESDNALDSGQSHIHLLAAMIEIARHLLCRGGIIAYGGDLRRREQYGFTRQLFQLVYAYKDTQRPPLQRIKNYLAYHFAAELSRNEEASLLELAQFEKPLPQNLAARFGLQKGARRPVPDDSPSNRYIRSRCLTAMREAMTEETDARVLMGGRVSGHQGKYPGVLEEAYLYLRARKPLYLIGAYGGCTRLLIEAIREKRVGEALTRDFQMNNPRLAIYQAADGSEQQARVPFAELEASYLQHEHDADIGERPINYEEVVGEFLRASVTDLNNGLTADENEELFITPDLDRIVFLLIKGLSEVRGS
ncbi:MAG TPA: TIR domain-containing protein [Pyrinomonadaceae bacterium]|nr:TIR domain-containing protein [Pyrinomonadaceae bacterium]